MTITFQLPNELENNLRQTPLDLNAEAKEALLVSLYRQSKLSHLALAQALNLDRSQTEDVLHKHNVTEDLGSPQDYLNDLENLQNFLSNGRS